jgi:hypothetical protein
VYNYTQFHRQDILAPQQNDNGGYHKRLNRNQKSFPKVKTVCSETEQVARRNFGLHKYLTAKPETKSISVVQGLISITKTDNSAYFINP